MDIKKMKAAILAGTIGMALGASAVYGGGRVMWPGHKHLQRAENMLGQAKTALNNASHDCGGHRVAAIELVDKAMVEVRQARKWANEHPEAFK
jgi:hypothetical protein